MSGVSRGIDRIEVIFDDENLAANAGLLVPATLMARLGLEALINDMVRLRGRIGGSRPGRKVLTLVAAILAGATHIDHANVLRAGATGAVLAFRVMAPSTLGTFLRAFTFGHIRQLDRVIAETIGRAWAMGAGPGDEALVIDMDSTICEVHGHAKDGAAYGRQRRGRTCCGEPSRTRSPATSRPSPTGRGWPSCVRVPRPGRAQLGALDRPGDRLPDR